MNKNPLLKHLNDANIGVAWNASKHFPTNIARVLLENWAKIVSFTVWHGPDGPFATIPQQDVVIAPFDMELPGMITSWQVLRWKLWNEKEANSESLDIDDISPNSFALRVAELIDESKFKLPEWFNGYNFRWEWSVMEHPITKERCRKIRLFKTYNEWNTRETYAHIHLDEQGQLFNASLENEPKKASTPRFMVSKKVASKNILSPDVEIEVSNIYQQIAVGERNPENKNISFFKNTEI